jgi:hypothetical protein
MGMLLITLSSHGVERDVTFFHISDQHYDDESENPDALVPTINAMNALPGTGFPARIGGIVDRPRGVILTGDLTNDGMPLEWDRFLSHWGLTGKEGILEFPVFEGAGNHDGGVSSSTEGASGYVRRQIIDRNRSRPGVTHISPNGLHYSWDWDDVHFVMLNEYAGLEDAARYPGNPQFNRKMQRYGNPAEESLQFLRDDLRSQVGKSGRPVVILQHYGLGGFPLHPWDYRAAWWTEEHVMRLWESIEGFNVISLLTGHDGSESVIRWNGIPNRHMDDPVRFGVYRIKGDTMQFAQRNAHTGQWEVTDEQSVFIQASLPPELVQGPYLVYSGEPGTVTALWRTRRNIPVTLKWGDDRFEYEDGSVVVQPYDMENHLYRYTLTGLNLELSTQFTLEIDGRYAPGMFYAGPSAADRVKFFVIGSRPDSKHCEAVYATLYDRIYEDAAYHSILLQAGSMVMDPDSMAAWDNEFFSRDKSASKVRWMLSRAPLAVAPGDSALTQKLFPSEGAVPGAYGFDYGPVHIAVLNADQDLHSGSVQEQWLREDLETSPARFRMIVWNSPADGSGEEHFLEQLAPICDAFGVDLCVSGNIGGRPKKVNDTLYLDSEHSIAIEVEGDRMRCELFDAGRRGVEDFEIYRPFPDRSMPR